MASRNFTHPWTLDRGVVQLYCGGTGAGAANLTALLGSVASIVHTGSTGLYTVTLADKYNKFLMLSSCVIDATTPDDWEVVVTAEDVASAKTIGLAVFKGGALTDLTTDEKLKLCITVSNTTVPPTAR